MFASRNANAFIKHLGSRSYALSRFSKRSAGAGRSRGTCRLSSISYIPSGTADLGYYIAQIPTIKKAKVDEDQVLKHEFEPPRHPERLVNRHDLDSGLGRLLLQRNTLVIERKVSFIRIYLIY